MSACCIALYVQYSTYKCPLHACDKGVGMSYKSVLIASFCVVAVQLGCD